VNIVPISDAKPEPNSPLEFALKYAALDWKLIPVWWAENGKCACGSDCTSPNKHPITALAPAGQNSASSDPAILRRWWTRYPKANIGVFLQASKLAAVDIDPRNGGLDTIEQIESEHGPLVSDVMQFTGGGGEHRVFSAPVGTNLPGKLGPGIDLKLNGYILLEPSSHVKGGAYAFEASSSPIEGAIPSPLPDWLRGMDNRPGTPGVAAATRHATPAQIDELRSALAYLPADDRDTWVRFGHALKLLGQSGFMLWDEWSQRSDKYDPAEQTRVWSSLKPNALHFETIFFAAQQVGWVNPLASTAPSLPDPIAAPAVITTQAAAEPEPMPDLHLPGMLGQVEDWVNATSRKLQPVFATQTAIAFGSVLFGRRYVTTQRNWSSLYLLNIGKSASGKEHGKWALEALLDACQLQRLIGPAGYTSDSGLLSSLHRQPVHVAIIDEFGKVLEAASIKHGARAASTLRSLMEVWARCDGTLRPQGYSTFGMSDQDADKIAEKSVINPALTLLAMTTPDTFFDTIGSAAARDGFLNRFLIVESDIGRQAGQHVPPLAVPGKIIDFSTEAQKTANLIDASPLPGVSANARVIPFTAAAAAAYAAFEIDCLRLMDTHDEDGLAEMFGRTCEMAMRLGLIVALGNGESAISGDAASWAIDYVRHNAIRTVDRLKTSVADSEFEGIKNQVLALISRAPKGLTERDLSKLSRRFRALDMRGQVNVLNSLAFTADIVRVEFPSTSGRGSARKAWIIPADNADNPVPV
jgi:hypothetical protein